MAAPPQEGAVPLWIQVAPYLLIFVIFYMLVIAPARRKAKAHAKTLESLKPGDRVLTSGGLYGTVVGVDDTKVQLRIADQVKVEVAKHAISDVTRAGE
jgi:preprotein translocase subunit YajC